MTHQIFLYHYHLYSFKKKREITYFKCQTNWNQCNIIQWHLNKGIVVKCKGKYKFSKYKWERKGWNIRLKNIGFTEQIGKSFLLSNGNEMYFKSHWELLLYLNFLFNCFQVLVYKFVSFVCIKQLNIKISSPDKINRKTIWFYIL